jgi:hypothetical protein
MTCMLRLQVRGSMRNTIMTMRAYGRLIFFDSWHVHERNTYNLFVTA